MGFFGEHIGSETTLFQVFLLSPARIITRIFTRFCEKRLLATLRISVCSSARNNSAPTEQTLIRFHSSALFRKFVAKIQVSLKSGKNNGYFT